MPYSKLSELPDSVKSLPAHAKEIYMKAFNSAFEQYKDRGGKREALAHATSWAAVEKVYKKVDDTWVAKEAIHPHGEHVCVCSKCNNEITVEADVKCNTQECSECGAPMIAKEAGERRESVSDEDRRNTLQTALISYYGLNTEAAPKPGSINIEEVFDNELVYNIDGQAYKMSYEINEGVPTFGEPEKVVKRVVYQPMESLQKTYSEIIQEVGRRNANIDSARVKKIMALCQELLSSEGEIDDSKLKKAVKEADATLAWLKEQAAMKTEDGQKFPEAAYAYVPDAGKPSSWKLRIWEDTEKKVTRAQLGRSTAALSPGGFRGQKVAILAADLSGVKRKIRAEYRKLNVEDEEIPRWVKEVETREILQDYMPLTEAKFDKGRAAVIVIKAGFNATSDRYYPADVLRRDFGIFEGMKMYADHPTEQEDKDRPERSIKDWVGTLSEVVCDENGVVTGIAEIIEPWLMQKLASLRDKQMLSEMGISINAVGSASKGTIDGKETLVIEKLVAARSVDFVTEPGAGGIVTFYESDRDRDIDLIELSTLREKRPDLVKALESNIRAEISKEVKRKMELEEQVTELNGKVEALTTERDGLQAQVTEAEKAKVKAEAQAVVKEAVDKAELPNAAKERILERFKDAESADGIEDVIQGEKDYIAKLSEAGKVKNLGATKVDPEKSREALKEAARKMNPDYTDAQIETFVSGK